MSAAIGTAVDSLATNRDDDTVMMRAGRNLMHIWIVQASGYLRPASTIVIADKQTADFDGREQASRRFTVGSEIAYPSAQLGTGRKAAAGGTQTHTGQFLPVAAVASPIKRRRPCTGEKLSRECEQCIGGQARHIRFGALPLCAAVVCDEKTGMLRRNV